MSMDELATHCKPGDYFIALYGQIIDVSNFISKHPGGEKILKANAGKDATQKFQSIWVFAFVIAFLFYVHSGSFMFILQNFVTTSLISSFFCRYPCQFGWFRLDLQMVSRFHCGHLE